MSTALMASKQKRNPKTVAIAKAILDEYGCKNVEDMQDAIKDIFGSMFEAMLGENGFRLDMNQMTMALKALKTDAMDITVKP